MKKTRIHSKIKHSLRESKGFSLKLGIMAVVGICWVLPICVVVSVQSFFISSSLDNQISEMVSRSMEYSMQTMQNELTAAINSSRQASYDTVIRDAYRSYTNDGNKIRLYQKVTAYLNDTYKYNDSFLNTIVFLHNSPDTMYYAASNVETFSAMRYYKESVHDMAVEAAENAGTSICFLRSNERLYMIRNIVDSKFSSYAVIVTELNKKRIFEGIENVLCAESAEIYLNGEQISIMGETDGLADKFDGIAVNYGEFELIRAGSDFYICSSANVMNTTIKCILKANGTLLLKEMYAMRTMLIVIILFAVPLMLMVILVFYRFVSRPMRTIVDAAEHVENGEMGYQMPITFESREMRYLMKRFNSMSANLKYLFDRSYAEQMALQDARIKALQSQINPHFLNNTLEIINWEARMAGNDRINSMIEALSTMLTAATARGGSAFVSLAEEMTYVDAYLYIISVRFGKRLTVKKEIDESLYTCKVPQLIMQPVVENAVEHGVTPMQKGELMLKVYKERENIVIDVENSGRLSKEDMATVERLLSDDGLSSESGEVQKHGGHVGIQNVNQRLKIIYGTECGLTIRESESGGTLARIVIKMNNEIQQMTTATI